MEIMERIALALEKVESIKKNEQTVYENLRKDLAKDVETAINKRPNIDNELDPKIVADHILPSIVGKMPDAKVFGKELEATSQKVVQSIANANNNIRNSNAENVTLLGISSTFLAILCLILGLLTWHYSNYKIDAYKYNFAKKYTFVNGGSIRYGLLDSVGVNDFNFIEMYVDTTDVEKILQEKNLKREQKRKAEIK